MLSWPHLSQAELRSALALGSQTTLGLLPFIMSGFLPRCGFWVMLPHGFVSSLSLPTKKKQLPLIEHLHCPHIALIITLQERYYHPEARR